MRRCISKSSEPQEFAVKILDLSLPTYEEAQELLSSTSKEVECLRLCHDHPNVCKLKEAFFSDSYIFLVLELCKGGENRAREPLAKSVHVILRARTC